MEEQIITRNLNLYYAENHALKDINMEVGKNQIVALIGPSGCGKSTFLKTLNRMNDLVENVRITGEVLIDDENIYAKDVDVTVLRKKNAAWYSKNRIRSRCQFTTISLMVPKFTGSKTKQHWMISWKKAYAEPLYGKKSKTD
jgi:ABC-type phosphate transport system ATPase subunit